MKSQLPIKSTKSMIHPYPEDLTPGFTQLPHKVLDGETKRVENRMDDKGYATVEVLMLTDLQYGHKKFNHERFDKFHSWILDQPNRFVILGGDLVDAANVLSVGSPYDNIDEAAVQVRGCIQMLMPLQRRILGYVGGNHERRGKKTYGDLGYLIASELQVPYSSGMQLIDIYYEAHNPFTISVWHGTGASRTKGARVNVLHRFMQQGDSQLYLMGHLTEALVTFDWRALRYGKSEIKLKKICGAMSTGFMDYWNTYAEVAGYPPSDTMMARTILEPDGHWEVTMR